MKTNLEPSSSAKILQFFASTHGLTQVELASALWVCASFISRILRSERNITITHLEKLAKLAELPLAVFIWRALRPTTVSKSKENVYAEIDSLLREVFPDASCKPGEVKDEIVQQGG